MDYSIFNTLSIPFCIINSTGEIIFKNDSFISLTGVSEGSELSLDDSHELFNEYRKNVTSNFTKALTGVDTKCFVALKSFSGNRIPAELYFYPMILDSGHGIALIVKPVEDRAVSFDRAVQKRSEHSSIYDYSPCPILTLNSTGAVVRSGSAADNFFASTREALIENEDLFLSFFSSYSAEKIKVAIYEICSNAKSFVRLNDLKVINAADHESYCNLALYKLNSDKEDYEVELVIEDITKVKALEVKLSKMNKVQIFSDMTKGLLHSFNNIINIIINRTQMLSQLTDKVNILDGLTSINDSACDAATQIRRIQEFISSDTAEGDNSSAEIIELVRDAIEFASIHFKVEKKEKGRSISINKRYFTKAMVSGNLKLLREILVSMIFRISSYIAEKGVVELEVKQDDDIIITVCVKSTYLHENAIDPDEGFLPEIELRRIADKINVRIIEEESVEMISLSAVIPARMIALDKVENSKSETPKIRDCDILIVEDEPALSEILFELFDYMGNRVTIHEDAESGLAEFKAHNYDIVISDYGLHGMSGTELLSQIRELSQTVVTVLLTGWMIDDIQNYEKQIDLFLQKPFQIESLLNNIGTILQEKR